jgi:hypothetical protein
MKLHWPAHGGIAALAQGGDCRLLLLRQQTIPR